MLYYTEIHAQPPVLQSLARAKLQAFPPTETHPQNQNSHQSSPTDRRRDRSGNHFLLKLPRFPLGGEPSLGAGGAKPFSRSSGLRRGVGGTSSSLTRPDRDSLADFGNSERRGVKAVTTLLADLRMVSRTFHSLFFAR